MSLPTGTSTPTGQIITGDSIYIEGGPDIYFQDADAPLANDPDSNGAYWGLSGTSANPIYQIECYDDLSQTDDVTMNPITCQNLGEIGDSQRRNHIELAITIKSLLPFDILSRIFRGGAVTQDLTDGTEFFGIGEIRAQFYHVFMPRVYDLDTGDYIALTIHKAKISSAGPLSTPYADVWSVPATFRGYADTTKPRDQRFATWFRLDPSMIP